MSAPIPVTLLGGFLGAGKTTLLNHLLSSLQDRRVAVLVNDFGAINIDAALVRRHEGETLELANGCICCSLGNNLLLTLIELLNRPDPPEHLLIEASGVADPAKLAQIPRADPGLSLDGVIVVVDGEQLRQQADDRYTGETVRRQLAAADLIIINKRDLLNAASLVALRQWLVTTAPGVAILEALHGVVPMTVLLGLAAAGDRASGLDAMVRHPDYTTLSLNEPRAVNTRVLRQTLERLPSGVLRVKGVLRTQDGQRLVVQGVGKRLDLQITGDWVEGVLSRLVLIGLRGQFDPVEWQRRLQAMLQN